MSAPVFTNPTELLAELGITEPNELEIEVIAQYCEATVVYKPLKGCAARITGNSDRAIITIDSQSRRERQRFSAAHELGHWMFDRGQVSYLSCEEAVFIQQWSKFNPETRANRYASDLLMPVKHVQATRCQVQSHGLQYRQGFVRHFRNKPHRNGYSPRRAWPPPIDARLLALRQHHLVRTR